VKVILFIEIWTCGQAASLAPEDTEGFAHVLMEGVLCGRVLPAALTGASPSSVQAADVIVGLYEGLAQEGNNMCLMSASARVLPGAVSGASSLLRRLRTSLLACPKGSHRKVRTCV
jgi:hypothetical protein